MISGKREKSKGGLIQAIGAHPIWKVKNYAPLLYPCTMNFEL